MATNFVTANYQEVIDLHTESDTVSVIGIHTPNTPTPVKMLKGFWDQFRKVKYNGCSISLVPAARLPADPLQVSYAAGEPTIDPRDMLNPILFHGCHGDDMGTILNQLYSGDAGTDELSRKSSDSIEQNVFSEKQVGNDYVDALYYKALTDCTWLKAHPQSGFRKSGLRPLVHRVVANMSYSQFSTLGSPDGPTAMGTGQGYGQLGPHLATADNVARLNVSASQGPLSTGTDGTEEYIQSSMTYTGQMFGTSRMEPLGWLDTHSTHVTSEYQSASLNGQADNDKNAIGDILSREDLNALNTIPKVFMGMIMLPPAYKTEQYFRLVISHNFGFKGFRGASMINRDKEMVNNAPSVFNFN